MKDKHLIEIAYEYAKNNFGKTPFSFKELVDSLAKKVPDIKEKASDLYIEILQDIRFISLGKQKWSLRENFTLSEINKISSSMFGLEEYHEEDADKYMSDSEKKAQNSKKEIQEDYSDFIDEDDENISDSSGGSSDETEDDDLSKSDDFEEESDDEDVEIDDVEEDFEGEEI